MRARDLGITIGDGTPGPLNAITDVAGRPRRPHDARSAATVRSSSGRDPVRTGVTVVVPHDGDVWTEPRLRRLPPTQRQRRADRPRVDPRDGAARRRDRHHQHALRRGRPRRAGRPRGPVARAADEPFWSLPVVGETYDGDLNDINGFHVRPEHVDAALAGARRRCRGRGERRAAAPA